MCRYSGLGVRGSSLGLQGLRSLAQWFDVFLVQLRRTIGASIITNTVLGVPYDNYSIMGPEEPYSTYSGPCSRIVCLQLCGLCLGSHRGHALCPGAGVDAGKIRHYGLTVALLHHGSHAWHR